jgi:hypothetical protein
LGNSLTAGLLILHSLLAVALLGAITHQAIALKFGPDPAKVSFAARYRSVDASAYAGAIVLLFTAGTLLGALLYPSYRLTVRPVLELHGLRAANGAFEIKEHLSALGLLLLPAYWVCWRKPLGAEHATARAALTWLLAAIVWWNFIVGDLLTNIRGLFH